MKGWLGVRTRATPALVENRMDELRASRGARKVASFLEKPPRVGLEGETGVNAAVGSGGSAV